MNKLIHVLTGLFFVMVAGASSATAGWVMTDADGEETVISKGMVRSEWDDGRVIIDANEDAIHFIDDARKMIASGAVDEWCDGVKKMVESMMARLPAEQREMMKEMMGNGKVPEVVIVKKGPGGQVSGFETTRYEVTADGELYEELWLSDDKALMKDCQPVMKLMGRFTTCMQAISSMGSSMSPEASPEYAKIFELGIIVKSVGHDDDDFDNSADIMTIAQRDVPADAFALPEGYKTVPFEAFWTMDEE